MPSLAKLINTTKKFCKNTKISDEELFNGFISTYVNAGNLRNKNGEPFWLNKSRVSEILKQKWLNHFFCGI